MKEVILILLAVFSITFGKNLETGKQLVERYNCLSCHDFSQKRTGPSFAEISKKYGTSEKAVERVANIIINPPSFMPPFKIPFSQAKAIAKYVLTEGAKAKKKKETEDLDQFLDSSSQFH
ncbi:MAG: cytochrome C [Aquificota bacterium]|nr:MAG: cytochrome C [Aquificota bacterium]